eukprot:g116.t1
MGAGLSVAAAHPGGPHSAAGPHDEGQENSGSSRLPLPSEAELHLFCHSCGTRVVYSEEIAAQTCCQVCGESAANLEVMPFEVRPAASGGGAGFNTIPGGAGYHEGLPAIEFVTVELDEVDPETGHMHLRVLPHVKGLWERFENLQDNAAAGGVVEETADVQAALDHIAREQGRSNDEEHDHDDDDDAPADEDVETELDQNQPHFTPTAQKLLESIFPVPYRGRKYVYSLFGQKPARKDGAQSSTSEAFSSASEVEPTADGAGAAQNQRPRGRGAATQLASMGSSRSVASGSGGSRFGRFLADAMNSASSTGAAEQAQGPAGVQPPRTATSGSSEADGTVRSSSSLTANADVSGGATVATTMNTSTSSSTTKHLMIHRFRSQGPSGQSQAGTASAAGGVGGDNNSSITLGGRAGGGTSRSRGAAGGRRSVVESTVVSTWEEECAICKLNFEKYEEVVGLPCAHVFHYDCCKDWLSRQHTCPMCRFELEVEDDKFLRSVGRHVEAALLEEEKHWFSALAKKGDPVHFGLSCSVCRVAPLFGKNAKRCRTCFHSGRNQHYVCGKCSEAGRSVRGHPSSHVFEDFDGFAGVKDKEALPVITLMPSGELYEGGATSPSASGPFGGQDYSEEQIYCRPAPPERGAADPSSSAARDVKSPAPPSRVDDANTLEQDLERTLGNVDFYESSNLVRPSTSGRMVDVTATTVQPDALVYGDHELRAFKCPHTGPHLGLQLKEPPELSFHHGCIRANAEFASALTGDVLSAHYDTVYSNLLYQDLAQREWAQRLEKMSQQGGGAGFDSVNLYTSYGGGVAGSSSRAGGGGTSTTGRGAGLIRSDLEQEGESDDDGYDDPRRAISGNHEGAQPFGMLQSNATIGIETTESENEPMPSGGAGAHQFEPPPAGSVQLQDGSLLRHPSAPTGAGISGPGVATTSSSASDLGAAPACTGVKMKVLASSSQAPRPAIDAPQAFPAIQGSTAASSAHFAQAELQEPGESARIGPDRILQPPPDSRRSSVASGRSHAGLEERPRNHDSLLATSSSGRETSASSHMFITTGGGGRRRRFDYENVVVKRALASSSFEALPLVRHALGGSNAFGPPIPAAIASPSVGELQNKARAERKLYQKREWDLMDGHGWDRNWMRRQREKKWEEKRFGDVVAAINAPRSSYQGVELYVNKIGSMDAYDGHRDLNPMANPLAYMSLQRRRSDERADSSPRPSVLTGFGRGLFGQSGLVNT